MAFKALHNPQVQHYLRELMMQSGMVTKAIKYLLEAMEAERNGHPDWVARSRAADTVFRLAGAYDKELTGG